MYSYDAISRRLAKPIPRDPGPYGPGQTAPPGPNPNYTKPTANTSGQYGGAPAGGGGGAPVAPPEGSKPGPVPNVGRDSNSGNGGNLPKGKGGKKPSKGGLPSLASFLAADPDYQQGILGLNKSWQDYASKYTANRGNVIDENTITTERLAREKKESKQDLLNDFAARGMLMSGLFGKAQNELETNYGEQGADLGRQFQNVLANMLMDWQSQRDQNILAKQQLRDIAIAKRADRYNLTR